MMCLGVSMNSRHSFLMAWKPMMIPPQRVVLTCSPLQVHSSLASPRSSAAFDPIVLKQTNFLNPQRISDYIHACSSIAWRHSFTALHLKMMHKMNYSNPPRLRG
jgi:hypothetical protein